MKVGEDRLKEIQENRRIWYGGMGQATKDFDYLLAEIERMKPVVEALRVWRNAGPEVPYETELDETQEALIAALDVYEASEPK